MSNDLLNSSPSLTQKFCLPVDNTALFAYPMVSADGFGKPANFSSGRSRSNTALVSLTYLVYGLAIF